MTDHEILLQLMQKMDELQEHYNHTTTAKLTELATDNVWQKWLLMFLVATILTQSIILIWNSYKTNQKDKNEKCK